MRVTVARSVKRHPGRPFWPLPAARPPAMGSPSRSLRPVARSPPSTTAPSGPTSSRRSCRRLRRHRDARRHPAVAPHGPVGRRALSARALRRLPRVDEARPRPLPLRPAPPRAGGLRASRRTRSPSSARTASCSRASAAVVARHGVFWRSRFKYGDRAYRFTLLEAGHVGQNLVLAATALGLAAVPIGGFFDRRVDAFLGIDGLHEASLYLLPARRHRQVSTRRGRLSSGRPSRWPRRGLSLRSSPSTAL